MPNTQSIAARHTWGEPETPHPDAIILALAAEVRAMLAQVEGGGLSDGDAELLMAKVNGLELQIARTPAQTVAGLAVKLRIAEDYWQEDKAETTDLLCLRAALADAERLAATGSNWPEANPLFPMIQQMEGALVSARDAMLAIEQMAGSEYLESDQRSAWQFIAAAADQHVDNAYHKWRKLFEAARGKASEKAMVEAREQIAAYMADQGEEA